MNDKKEEINTPEASITDGDIQISESSSKEEIKEVSENKNSKPTLKKLMWSHINFFIWILAN